ncbi:glutamate-rich protein 5 [Otolemur garnettii]|uniref:glutamate-rich protein 5 n=1 Tax=Otolemur garnettii TaxID=30611 RepID=UPI000C7F2285|nr:glutamate-rich protein 5 [Otolemur garnettii]
MGCSSSTLNKAGDSSRFRSVTSNEHFSTTEKSESCFAQPKPCTLGRESALYDNTQRESLPPLGKLKVSAVSTANGVKSLSEQPLEKNVAPGKDAVDHSESTEETQPTEGPGGKDDTPGTEEEKKDVQAVTGARPLKGSAEAEHLGTKVEGQPLRTAGERVSPGTVEGDENPPPAGEMKLLGTTGNILPLETAIELQPQEAMGKDEQGQLLETIPKEDESPEVLEGSQLVEIAQEQHLQATPEKQEQSQLLETIPKEDESPDVLEGSQLVEIAEEQQLQATPGKQEESQLLETILKKDESPEVLEGRRLVEIAEEQQLQATPGKQEQSQLLETIPKEDKSPEVLEGSQLVETPVMNDPLHKTPEGPGRVDQIQLEGIVGSLEHSAGTAEPGARVEMTRKVHSNEEDQHIEGETGEKMETEMENEEVSEGAETKEEETGEAVDLSAAA